MRPHILLRALVLAGLCSAPLTPVWADAQSDRLDALEKHLEVDAKLIEKLTARLAELEGSGKAPAKAASAAATSAPAPDQTQAIAALRQTVDQLSAGMSQRGADNGLPLHGFADVGGAWSRGDDPTKLRGFNGGTLDIYLTPQFSQRSKGLVELVVEYTPEGVVALDLERLQIGYILSDAVTLWAGRFHTPFGLWNTSFHHGANLQTSVTRPRFVDFEDKGGIIPAHSVGLWASGKTALGNREVTYDAYVANGPSISNRTLDFRAFTDDSSNKMLGFNLGWEPSGSLTGLTVGVHGFGSDVRVYDISSNALSVNRLRMGGAYIGYDENDWEVISEYYQFKNADAAGGKTRSSRAWFAQAGRTFGSITPFVRVERTALNPDDNFFRSQKSGRSYRRDVLGLRYALDPKSSLKLEFSNTREDATVLVDETGASVPSTARSYQRAAFQYSVAF